MRMTSEEPRPIDSFCPEPGPREWGPGRRLRDKDVLSARGWGRGAGSGAIHSWPGPSGNGTEERGRSLFKPYELPTKDRYTGGLSINAHEY